MWIDLGGVVNLARVVQRLFHRRIRQIEPLLQKINPLHTGADKAYDTRDFVDTGRESGLTPHVARRQHGAIDDQPAGIRDMRSV